jgi:hypothetical protein
MRELEEISLGEPKNTSSFEVEIDVIEAWPCG